MFQIDIANKQTSVPIDRTAMRRAVRQTLTMEGVAEASISIAVVDDPTIHQINRDYLQHDFATDVITFLLECQGGLTKIDPSGPRGIEKSIEGEIVLSAATATRTALEVGWSANEEMTLYIVHGLLHLCGYDDHGKTELPIMRRRERQILESLGLNLPARDDDPPSQSKTTTRRKSAAAERTAVSPSGSKAKSTSSLSSGPKKTKLPPLEAKPEAASKRRAKRGSK